MRVRWSEAPVKQQLGRRLRRERERNEGFVRGAKVGQRIRCLNEVIDKGVVLKECCAKAPGGNGYRGAGTSLFDGFVNGREMNAASERKHVFEDEYAVRFVWTGVETAAAKETLRGLKTAAERFIRIFFKDIARALSVLDIEEDAQVW